MDSVEKLGENLAQENRKPFVFKASGRVKMGEMDPCGDQLALPAGGAAAGGSAGWSSGFAGAGV